MHTSDTTASAQSNGDDPESCTPALRRPMNECETETFMLRALQMGSIFVFGLAAGCSGGGDGGVGNGAPPGPIASENRIDV